MNKTKISENRAVQPGSSYSTNGVLKPLISSIISKKYSIVRKIFLKDDQ